MPVATERTVVVTLKPVTCYRCGIVFGLSRDYYDDRQRDGGRWHCPNGHPQVFAETTEERLRRELEATERRLQIQQDRADFWQAEEAIERRQRIALKSQLTKARRRAAHGVCPVPDCKRRPFADLAQHMAQAHADFIVEADRTARNGDVTQPKTAGQIAETVDGFYGSMRKVASGQGSATRYRCQCGWSGPVGGRNNAGRHARTCAQARQPWKEASTST
jgi:hypothetical protein